MFHGAIHKIIVARFYRPRCWGWYWFCIVQLPAAVIKNI